MDVVNGREEVDVGCNQYLSEYATLLRMPLLSHLRHHGKDEDY